MKNRLTKLSELKATLIIASIVSLVLILVALVGIFFNQPGWVIGVAIGSMVELVGIILIDKGSGAALKDSQSAIYLLTYFARMILFVGAFAALVVLQFVVKISVFKNSCWGMIIGYFPSTIITVATQLKFHEEPKEGK